MNWCEEHQHVKKTCPWCEIEKLEAVVESLRKEIEMLRATPEQIMGEIDKAGEIPYDEIIAALNEHAGTNYRSKSMSTRRIIRARWQEGYRLEHFLRVIENKAADWLKTEHEKYLRPETLFNATKFEGYLNQKGVRDEKAGRPIRYEQLSTTDGALEDISDAEVAELLRALEEKRKRKW